jgi:hypothetical protein
MRPRRATSWALALAGALGIAACGAPAEDPNADRPAASINVTAAIIDGRIELSPRTVGAGPIRLLVTNQTDAPRTVTLETDEVGGSQPGIRRSTSAIVPRGVATLQADLREGAYRVSADGGGIAAVAIKVGAPRPSAQGDLLQP